jgi:hypothetical protein
LENYNYSLFMSFSFLIHKTRQLDSFPNYVPWNITWPAYGGNGVPW